MYTPTERDKEILQKMYDFRGPAITFGDGYTISSHRFETPQECDHCSRKPLRTFYFSWSWDPEERMRLCSKCAEEFIGFSPYRMSVRHLISWSNPLLEVHDKIKHPLDYLETMMEKESQYLEIRVDRGYEWFNQKIVKLLTNY